VKSQFLTFPDITLHRVRTLREHLLETTSGRAEDFAFVAQLGDFQDGTTRPEREGPAGEFQGIHVAAHGVQNVLKAMPSHRCIVRPTDLGNPFSPWLLLPLIHS